MAKSYVSIKSSWMARLQEIAALYRLHTQDVPAQVHVLIQRLRDVEQFVQEHASLRLENLRMLDIGPGQRLRQISYFALKNDVTGINMDVIPRGVDLVSYARMMRRNGFIRTTKTIARKLTGVDRCFFQELAKQLGVAKMPRSWVLQMDAARMSFDHDTFDFVNSYSVFEHIPEPEKVLAEVKRVLRPGGVAYLSLHLYTSINGSHDPRIFGNVGSEIPSWAHLRPQYEHLVQPNCYLNRKRLTEWEELFSREMPGAMFRRHQYANAQLKPELCRLREVGELEGYSDEELLTVDWVACWKKPSVDR